MQLFLTEQIQHQLTFHLEALVEAVTVTRNREQAAKWKIAESK